MNLARKTVKGMIWAYGAFFGGRLATLISTIVLARLLVPEDFGIIAFGIAALNLIEAARSLGINDALVYTTEDLDKAANSAFIMNIFFGFVQFFVVLFFAPLALFFMNDPRVVPVLQVMALAFPLNAIGMTHSALLQKELSFKRRFIPDVIAMFVKGALSIVLALMGFGMWALVIGYLSSSVVMGIGVWFVHSWRPNFHFYMGKAREMWNYGKHIFMLNILSIGVTQVAPLLTARLGAAELGYYSIASRLPELILLNIGNILTRVIFPTYVKMKHDMAMLTQSFFATTKYTAFITVAVGFGLSAIAPEMVVLIFGYKYEPAIPIARVLPLVGMTLTLAWNAGDVFKAIGRPDVSTKLLMIETVYIFGLIFLAINVWQTAFAVACANLLAYIISATLRMLLIRHFLKFNFLKFLEVFRGPFLAGGSMYLAVTLWRGALASMAPSAVLVSSVLVGAIVYIAVLYITDRKDVSAAAKMLMALIRRTPAQPAPTVDVYTAVGNAE